MNIRNENKQILQILIKFLLINNVNLKYFFRLMVLSVDYGINNNKYKYVIEKINNICLYSPAHFIDYAFVWHHTPEGNHYWQQLHREFTSFFYKIYKKSKPDNTNKNG